MVDLVVVGCQWVLLPEYNTLRYWCPSPKLVYYKFPGSLTSSLGQTIKIQMFPPSSELLSSVGPRTTQTIEKSRLQEGKSGANVTLLVLGTGINKSWNKQNNQNGAWTGVGKPS